ncbi:hypothetical protein J2Z76_001444 [Sedimentibacter acidaminivorans]|uniref:Uncharacterized protein n=1 Tax=Sedimentibacter acidaminivorans TaxID=913099 RepID=A0ABS4GD07_9FIRM|nr:hypothetical protein [Sedimentibacter acidaminivorans]
MNFLVIIMLLILTGCVNDNNHIEVNAYVDSAMDAMYKGNFIKYSEITGLEINKVEEIYMNGLNIESNAFANYFDIRNLTEEMQNEIINLYKSIYSKSKYEIENINDSGNGYLVDISIYPINIISLAYNDILLYIDEFNVKTFNGDFDNLNDEEFENEYVKGIIEVMKRYLPEIGYSEKNYYYRSFT